MRGSFTINGHDTYTTWGVILAEGSVEKFLAPPALKDYITNESALENGIQVITSQVGLPKVADRTITVEVAMLAADNTAFRTQLANFVSTLKGGVLAIKLTDHTADTFHCLYLSCAQFTDYNGRVAKLALRLIEPNPADRTSGSS